jgi:hypothetical protein
MAEAFETIFVKATEEAIHKLAEALADWLRKLVDVQCTGEHAAHDKPPLKESGDGQGSIGWAPVKGGAVVGYRTLGIAGLSAAGGNYMVAYDNEDGIRGIRHPSLSLWREYDGEMANLLNTELDITIDKALKAAFK